MNPFARQVLGYHGCDRGFADKILSGELSIANWRASSNPYDWIGSGIYFWEHSPSRAMRWAREHERDPAVIGAVIQLGRCFDLTDEQNTATLELSYRLLRESYDAEGKTMVENTGPERKARLRDCLVINSFLQDVAEVEYQTVRAAFTEREPAFDGSMLFKETHIQVVVRDPSCLVGVFRPTYGV